MIKRGPLAALLLSTSLALACGEHGGADGDAKPIDECDGLEPIQLSAIPSRVRAQGAVALEASGGTGHYRFALAAEGSSGELRGARLVAGPTPAVDVVTASDECGNSASLEVEVIAGFSVLPTRARIKPSTQFKLRVEGTLGQVTFRAEALASGGSINAEGLYQAGAQQGLDLIVVRDEGSGEEALVQYRVDPSAQFRGAPALLGLPSGARAKLNTQDGSGVVDWTVLTGDATVDNGVLQAAEEARGLVVLRGEDSFTREQTELKVRIYDELTRVSRPHGRLTDQGALVTGDFDGDGIQDVALGVPDSDLQRPTGGAVFVFKGSESGIPSEPTWIIAGEDDTANTGAVLAAGDLDGDGRDDLAISEPGADITTSESGAVLLYKFGDQGPTPLRPAMTGVGRGNFGASLAIADVDGDGRNDLLVGSPGADLAASSAINSRGVVDVFMVNETGVPDSAMVRLGGTDLAGDGTLKATSNLRFGRALAAADFNGDGHADVAILGSVNNTTLAGVPPARGQVAIAVHFGRGSSPAFLASPDLYILPSNPADGSEGSYRLFVAPGEDSKANRLLITADQLDSPDLSGKGGVKSGSNAGGALLFDLSELAPQAEAPGQPKQLGRGDAFAKVYGDVSGISAGRGAAIADIDGDGKHELVLGAPYASRTVKVNGKDVTTNGLGKLLVYPYSALKRGAELNQPVDTRFGAAAYDGLGVAVAAFAPGSASGLVAFAARSSNARSDFTGRLDAYLGSGSLSDWTVTSCELPARVASQQHGAAVSLLSHNGQPRALVGAPGFSGLGGKGDGNELGAGQALLYEGNAWDAPRVIHEGASSAYSAGDHAAYGGRMVGQDVGVSDFDGDGRTDLIVAAPQLGTPTASSTDYAENVPGCVTSSSQSNGGALIFLARSDGSYREGFRVFAVSDIAGCTPADSQACKRRELARNGLVGGFDFDGDGKQDLLLTRANGLEVFLGRAPGDAAPSKPSMVCDPAFSLPALAQGTSAPSALGDLDGDGCDEVAVRYANAERSGLLIAFGFDAAGVRCDGHQEPSWLRVSGDGETGLNNMQLGVASARAGKLLGDARDLVAVAAGLYPFEGATQPTVLLFEAAQLANFRPETGERLVSALNDGLSPVPLVNRERAPGFGRALAGNVDLSGDGVVDLAVSAPGAVLEGGGTGMVFVFAGGAETRGRVSPWLTALGDGRERANVGQDLSVLSLGAPATLGIGAPLSDRTGTANGTAWLLPLPL